MKQKEEEEMQEIERQQEEEIERRRRREKEREERTDKRRRRMEEKEGEREDWGAMAAVRHLTQLEDPLVGIYQTTTVTISPSQLFTINQIPAQVFDYSEGT